MNVNEKIKQDISSFSLPEFREIPDVGLYLDQVVRYINGFLSAYPVMQVTGSMITNYVKLKLVPRLNRKTYTREQIASFIFIVLAKKVISIDNIRLLMQKEENQDITFFYERFRSSMMTASKKMAEKEIEVTDDLYGNIACAIAYQMYLERYFDDQKK